MQKDNKSEALICSWRAAGWQRHRIPPFAGEVQRTARTNADQGTKADSP